MENLNKVKNKVEEMKAKYSLEQEQEDNPNHSDGFGMYWSGFFTCLKEISFFLDSLQQEQQEIDLEKDVESWFFNEISSKINVEHTMYYYFQECARRYFERGKNSK